MITIIDLGIGNLGSLKNMFDHLDVSCEIKKDISSIMKAKKIVLSGVGSFDSAMKKINYNVELKNILNDLVLIKSMPIDSVNQRFAVYEKIKNVPMFSKPELMLSEIKIKTFFINKYWCYPGSCFISDENIIGFNAVFFKVFDVISSKSIVTKLINWEFI
jgi:hypothetical protein